MARNASPSDIIAARYASPEMVALFSPERRIGLWRDLWIALAEEQRALGLPITAVQIAELKRYRNRINWNVASALEKETRHDVMAHVNAYGKQCRKAAGIIHLGATSTYVTDNADLILLREGLDLVRTKVAAVIDRLGRFAQEHRNMATIAFTHFQPAQPTTVGKRSCLWAWNFVMDLERLEFERRELRFHGVRGATGTQDSFLKLFKGDAKKVRELERRVTRRMGFDRTYPVAGQTYPRKVDTRIIGALAQVGESASKFANDIRLLQALHEIEEPRETRQIGSSAMPYKQNPMRSERMVALSRYVMNLVGNTLQTSAEQWFERTLDDSANRRLVLPQAFLVIDGVLELALNVAGGLRVNAEVIRQNLDRELPFFQTEEILMEAVRVGGNRQKLHDRIRKHSFEVIQAIRERGEANDLLSRLRRDPAFSRIHPKMIVRADASHFVGLAPEQVDQFVKEVVTPVRARYRKGSRLLPTIRV